MKDEQAFDDALARLAEVAKRVGANEERARIRQDLLDVIAEETWTYVPARGERVQVVSADILRTRFEQICPPPPPADGGAS